MDNGKLALAEAMKFTALLRQCNRGEDGKINESQKEVLTGILIEVQANLLLA